LRIPLAVENFYSERKVVFAHFFIEIPSMRVARPHMAIVDSGSPFTTISTRDALAFRLPIRHWQSGTTTRLGGFKFYEHELEATLTFRDAENKVVRFRQVVRALVPTKLDEGTIRDVQDIPSLIGNDFLEDYQFTFAYSPSSGIAYFERAEPQPTPTNQSGTTSQEQP
jgi:hypothetical protein